MCQRTTLSEPQSLVSRLRSRSSLVGRPLSTTTRGPIRPPTLTTISPPDATLVTISNVAPQKRARLEDACCDMDEYAQFLPPEPLAGEELTAVANTITSSEDFEEQVVHEHIIGEDEVAGHKRARYESSDEPMKVWRRVSHLFLDNLLRHDGLGPELIAPACHFCETPLNNDCPSTRFFRCRECGLFLQCHSCLTEQEVLHPLHVVKVSNQLLLFTTWSRKLMANRWYPATVSELGTCATFRALDLFRTLNVVGNVSANDFVGTLERLTDPTKLGKVPDRYRSFSRMARQYAFLFCLKRAGVGHEKKPWNSQAGGVVEPMEPGRLAVCCWACPRPGVNLPEGWENCGPNDEFLYSLMLALDTNFRLKNRIRANERQDPSLGSGWGYFVDDEPYREHLRDYVAEEDISTCIAFAALMQKETRLTTGL
ncbi:CxC2 domain-containing protein [Mycena indigotica]|uniref:CxC2 domain-containing protein n=1 Tax=Mycena indigotica TaxID=2126181 RepID=A0A8H6SI19_9AGAR|nr:CxC2 domain-containing protein [Mycena indigotica]KAF7299242.1 CxC2 domain-containing protein [Mycena indigotica]